MELVTQHTHNQSFTRSSCPKNPYDNNIRAKNMVASPEISERYIHFLG